MSVPDTAAAAVGVAGLAGVTNPGTAAAERGGAAEDEARLRQDARVEDEAPPQEHGELAAVPQDDVRNNGSAPVVQEPVMQTPVVAEPVLAEPVVDTEAKVGTAAGGDVDDWEAGSSAVEAPATSADDAASRADEAADKAEWESSWTDESGTPVHHHEYTDAHSPTLPGAETAAAETAPVGSAPADASAAPSGHLAADHPYGAGSAGAAADGSGPDGYPVKADAATMTYHDEDSPGYAEADADVWFESAAHAEAAGFRPPRRNRI